MPDLTQADDLLLASNLRFPQITLLTQTDRDDLLLAMARQLADDGRQAETLRAVLNRVAPTPPIVLPDPVG